MTITIDLTPDLLKRLRLLTPAETDEEAVLLGLQSFAEGKDQKSLIPLLGTFDHIDLAPEQDHHEDLH